MDIKDDNTFKTEGLSLRIAFSKAGWSLRGAFNPEGQFLRGVFYPAGQSHKGCILSGVTVPLFILSLEIIVQLTRWRALGLVVRSLPA